MARRSKGVFAWQGASSVFVSDSKFSPNNPAERSRASLDAGSVIGSKSRAPTSSINTETVSQRDKLHRLQRTQI